MPSPLDILREYWNHDSFRPMQLEIIQSLLDGKDTLALLPTGGGKSICFQVPAMLMDGLCIVVSPLIALMKDQVANLEAKGITAAALHSGLTYYEVQQVLQQATGGAYKFLYVSPERLETNLFKEYLPAIEVCMIAVDEAHCISQWGYDFRPPYLRIANLRYELRRVPVLALTASATPLVQEDIADKLKMKEPAIFRQSFERANLSYSVFKPENKIAKILEILQAVPGSGLVYCGSRRQTKNVAHLLSLEDISADYYHAGLAQEERDAKQQAWLTGKTRVMVCTNAFGMGIDKPDVRTVVHYDAPDCLENYYQEAGRAGRDGKKAYAVLLYQQPDITTLRELPDVRYPSVEDIRKVYQALADFLNIPVGAGQGVYYDFNLNDFVTNFSIDVHLAMNVIKTLEQEGHIDYNEQVFLPSQVMFTASRAQLRLFEEAYPQADDIIKCLLRTYEGIFDNRVSVFEKQIARLCRISPEAATQQLQQLYAFGIISYWPQKDTPQLRYLLNRAPAAHVNINIDQYFKRKELYKQRVATMLQYLQDVQQCRSRFIAAYFGDTGLKNCGNCDYCLQQKSGKLTTTDFKQIEQQVYRLLNSEGIQIKILMDTLQQSFHKDKSREVVQFLLAEQKIRMSDMGLVQKA
ncbi:RecQ family ATP-dependent DNA helicase [Deminuibacter soli]|uniref:ATP-dependent DNA helicase RecQ n=1 Tax=Deminuibacter soli TaxID=2291815 RepID=A0A3E1NFQ0_9BACT|nr:ATP-dependent DNA helicase RecQ [Deminuibacter soli]RFM26702.1 RecQ family ATP-dependent DNA helicase [Deminuibacter soli]